MLSASRRCNRSKRARPHETRRSRTPAPSSGHHSRDRPDHRCRLPSHPPNDSRRQPPTGSDHVGRQHLQAGVSSSLNTQTSPIDRVGGQPTTAGSRTAIKVGHSDSVVAHRRGGQGELVLQSSTARSAIGQTASAVSSLCRRGVRVRAASGCPPSVSPGPTRVLTQGGA